MASEHLGVFKRLQGRPMPSDPDKEMIRQFWGPNLAAEVLQNPERDEDIPVRIAEDRFTPQLLREPEFLLRKVK